MKGFRLLASLVILVLSAATAPAETNGNLIANPGFDGILPTGAPADWRLSPLGEFPRTLDEARAILSSEPFRGGGNAIKITLAAPRSYGVREGLSCKKGQRLKFSVWMKGNQLEIKGGEAGARLVFSNWKNRALHEKARAASFSIDTEQASFDWNLFEREFEVPEVADSLEVELRLRNGSGTIEFAAPSLTVVSGPRGEVADPSNKRKFREQNAILGHPKPGEARVVFIGDSITEGWKLPLYFPNEPFVNRGIGGQISSQVLDRFGQDVVALRPKIIWLLVGTNDIAASIPVSWISGNIAAIAQLCKEHGIRLIVASVLPVCYGAGSGKPNLRRTRLRPLETIVKLNRRLEAVCRESGATFLDLYTPLADATGQLPAELCKDGLHPNDKGYRRMAPLVLGAIQRLQAEAAIQPGGQ